MPDNQFGDAPASDPVAPCPLQKKHWVEIQLLDDFGQPVPNEEYQIVTPDGTQVRGYLDSRGWARVDPIESAGDCMVTFPNLDETLWRFDHSDGPLQTG